MIGDDHMIGKRGGATFYECQDLKCRRPLADLELAGVKLGEQVVDIEDVIAVVGDEVGADVAQGLASPDGSCAQLLQFACHLIAGHRDHFDGERKAAEGLDEFGIVGDADELRGGLGDDFLARQRTAAALDEVAQAGGLVGPIHVQAQRAGVVQIQHFDARGAQPRSRRDAR